MTDAPIDAPTGYHAIVDCAYGVAVVAATAAAREGYHSCNSHVKSRHGREYSLWSWGGCSAVLGAMQQLKGRS